MREEIATTWFRYLPVTPAARRWGLHVLDAGYHLMPPHTPYPPQDHPEDHDFEWEKGRTLPSFTLVYTTRGRGFFQSATAGHLNIEAGNLFILFPGEWHRYRPDPETGWDEHWVEFAGDYAEQIMNQPGFSKKRPVLKLGRDDDVLRLFQELSQTIRQGASGYEHIIAAQATQIVAHLVASTQRSSDGAGGDEDLVRRACFDILQQLNENIDFKEFAAGHGLSYSAFRKKFRRLTGLPPSQYQHQVRLSRAQQWLRQSDRSITEIAELVGYESIYYFSRVFKRKTGLTPSDYRRQQRPPEGG